jgi:hypothetical protein
MKRLERPSSSRISLMTRLTRPSDSNFQRLAWSTLITPTSAKVCLHLIRYNCDISWIFLLWHREDPEGIFYYDAASDISGDAKAKVFKVVANGKKYLHMKFYTSSENETYAEVGCALFISLLSLTLTSG